MEPPYFSRFNRRNGQVQVGILPNLNNRLCPLCKRILSVLLRDTDNGLVRNAFGLPHRKGRDLLAYSKITCPTCLLFADNVRQGVLTKGGAVTIRWREKNTPQHLRRIFNVQFENNKFDFELYHDLGVLGPRTLPPVNTESTFQLIRGYLGACKGHLGCQRVESSLPRRVVDVGSFNMTTSPFIYESEGVIATYLALSHCWGGDIPSRTERRNLEKRRKGIEISGLAKNFQDAIHITRSLGVRYIWIDALCIVQDNEDDWMREAACMSDIYRNALLVISASFGQHSEAGLLFQRSACVSRNFSLSAEGFEDVQIRHSEDQYRKSFDEDAAINRRGWALQERISAVAVVHIGFGPILWECRSQHMWEKEEPQTSHPVLKSMVPRLSLIGHSMENKNIDLWCTVVSLYTSRLLTFRHDKFSAIAGLAKLFEKEELTTGRYLAGLWEGAIHAHLLWYARKASPQRAFDLAPSWSWASVDGPVGWLPKSMPDFEIIDEDTCTVDLEHTIVNETNRAAQSMRGKLVVDGEVTLAHLDELRKVLTSDVRFPWWSLHHPCFLDARVEGSQDDGGAAYSDHINQCIIFDGQKCSDFHIVRLCSLRFRSGKDACAVGRAGSVGMTEANHSRSIIEEVSMSYYLLLEAVPSTVWSPQLFRRIGIMQFPKRLLPRATFEKRAITII